ncbi:HEAT repeat domain-containing protein [Streptomyces sp. NPDC002104]
MITDPDEDDGGVAALCAAVDAYDHEAAGELVAAGADPGRALPDGTTPLLRAVEGGSPALVRALLGGAARPPLSQAERGRLLDAARRWYGAGAEAELRRLTGAAGPADTVWVTDSEYEGVPEIGLGGRRVRAGHGGVLTRLEWEFRILAPVAELVERAVRFPVPGRADEEHVDRAASLHVLSARRSAQTWAEAAAFRRDPDPRRRAFAVDVVRDRLSAWAWYDTAHPVWYENECHRILLEWEPVEADADVLARILGVLRQEELAENEAVGVRRAGHPDPGVLREVPGLLARPLSPRGLHAVRALCRHTDAAVRTAAAEVLAGEELAEADRERVAALLRDADPVVARWTAYALGRGADRSPETAELLVERLGSGDTHVRLSAAYGLALRDDPRTPEAYARIGPLGPYADDIRAEGLWRWRHRNGPGGESR